MRTQSTYPGRGIARRLATRLAARARERAEGRAVALLARSETTPIERRVLRVEKRLSGFLAALFGPWTLLGSLGGEEIAPGVVSLTLASRVDDDGRLRELAVELERGQGPRRSFSGGEVLWSALRAPGSPGLDPHDAAVAEALAVVDDWPDARQALIDWWGDA